MIMGPPGWVEGDLGGMAEASGIWAKAMVSIRIRSEKTPFKPDLCLTAICSMSLFVYLGFAIGHKTTVNTKSLPYTENDVMKTLSRILCKLVLAGWNRPRHAPSRAINDWVTCKRLT